MKRILWVDLEMTGLDPKQAVILEFAGIITDLNLDRIDQYQAVVYQPEEELAKMNQWNRETHGQSGLLAEVPHGKPLGQVEDEVIAWLAPYFVDEMPVLAGNSIHQDRKFIDTYMKKLAAKLHYRLLDVSSFKQIFRHMYHVEFKKNNPHRALDDIIASIEELNHYLGYIKVAN